MEVGERTDILAINEEVGIVVRVDRSKAVSAADSGGLDTTSRYTATTPDDSLSTDDKEAGIDHWDVFARGHANTLSDGRRNCNVVDVNPFVAIYR